LHRVCHIEALVESLLRLITRIQFCSQYQPQRLG